MTPKEGTPMDAERALRESLAANDLTLWSASGACVVDVESATRNLAASLAARLPKPAPAGDERDRLAEVLRDVLGPLMVGSTLTDAAYRRVADRLLVALRAAIEVKG